MYRGENQRRFAINFSRLKSFNWLFSSFGNKRDNKYLHNICLYVRVTTIDRKELNIRPLNFEVYSKYGIVVFEWYKLFDLVVKLQNILTELHSFPTDDTSATPNYYRLICYRNVEQDALIW